MKEEWDYCVCNDVELVSLPDSQLTGAHFTDLWQCCRPHFSPHHPTPLAPFSGCTSPAAKGTNPPHPSPPHPPPAFLREGPICCCLCCTSSTRPSPCPDHTLPLWRGIYPIPPNDPPMASWFQSPSLDQHLSWFVLITTEGMGWRWEGGRKGKRMEDEKGDIAHPEPNSNKQAWVNASDHCRKEK